MRIPRLALVLCALLGSAATAQAEGWYKEKWVHTQFEIGVGATPGMPASNAAWLSGASRNSDFQPVMLQDIPVRDFRGKRLSVTVRLKNEGDVRARARILFKQNDYGSLTTAVPEENAPGDAWQDHRFVMDVPRTADTLTLNIGLVGKGKVWIDATDM